MISLPIVSIPYHYLVMLRSVAFHPRRAKGTAGDRPCSMVTEMTYSPRDGARAFRENLAMRAVGSGSAFLADMASLSGRDHPRIGERPDSSMGDSPIAGGRARVREDGRFCLTLGEDRDDTDAGSAGEFVLDPLGRASGELSAGFQRQLLLDVLAVGFDGLDAEMEGLRDLARAPPLADQAKHLRLAVAQPVEGRAQ